jgi:GNAT superfamily N-acetyltransferase
MIAHALITHPAHQRFTIRELHDSDERGCKVFLDQLDQDDIRLRFGSLHSSIHYLLPDLAGVGRSVALAAVDPAGKMLGIVNLAYLCSTSAEIAIIVRSDQRRRGIGRCLILHALHRAKDESLSEVVGHVLADNRPMLSLARSMGFRMAHRDGLIVEVRKFLSSRLEDAYAAKDSSLSPRATCGHSKGRNDATGGLCHHSARLPAFGPSSGP